MKRMLIPLIVPLACWLLGTLFLLLWLRFRYRYTRTLAQPPQEQEPPESQEPPPQPVWKHCSACDLYQLRAEELCPLCEQSVLVEVSIVQRIRVFAALELAREQGLPEEEHELFGAFVLGYEAHVGKFIPTLAALELYRRQRAGV